MYHSISDGADPTCIAPPIFNAHLAAIADLGWDVISLSDFSDWHAGRRSLSRPSLVITFDDGFDDFFEHAFPALNRLGFPATVFVPTARVGQREDWVGAASPARTLMSWPQLQELSNKGITIAPHSRTHANLAVLTGEALREEISGACTELAMRLSKAANHFAPPYGAVGNEALGILSEVTQLSVGVDFDVARRQSPRFNLPRLEMYYYKQPATFRAFLGGRGQAYFHTRRLMRRVRETLLGRGRKQVMM
jgi:peptidoglycan/xylan/chitin deacetylase (PgdA/CDA1 family)